MTDVKKVLVVDDEPDFASMVEDSLKAEGFEVEVAYNGVEALEKVKQSTPDAIVLDVMMPEMDGYKVCKELKKEEKFADIPIVMLTAVADHVSTTRYSHFDGMSMEADDYVPKGPGATDQIIESIKSFLKG